MLPRFVDGGRAPPVLGNPAQQILGWITAKVKIIVDKLGGKRRRRLFAPLLRGCGKPPR
jgi:hypothetical protein